PFPEVKPDATALGIPPPAVSLPPGQGPGLAGRYTPLTLHAVGGLGEVYLAHDEELSRDIALKRIQQKFAHQPESRRRFLLEAEVTARLEHPGVVPIHGLVQD